MVCSSENRVCGFEGARHLQHEAMTFSAWLEYISKEHPNVIPLKTLLVNTKDKSEKCIYTLPADQKADIKCLGKTIGMNPNALRVAAPKDIQETFSLPSESVFSLLHITMQPALLKKDGLKFRLCFDSSLLSVESPSRTVVLGHPVPNAGSVLIEHPVLLEGIRQLLPSEEILNVRAVPCEGTDSTYKQDAEKPKISQSTQKKGASGVQRKGKAGEGLEADKSASDETGGASGTGLVIRHAKEENFQEWYAEVLTKADLIEYHDVSGCYILRPWAYRMWEVIKDFLDHKLREDGVDNTYFPLFISQGALEREKDHVEGFAPEVAWVTKSGQSDLAEPIAIRPTSETVMYPSYAKWIRSHRDLPLRLNQWCNVVRWEFSHPMPFIRTREFLWQEGHTAWATLQEATREVHWSLDLYRQVYEDLLCVPVVQGRKTDKEKFAGALFTTTVETFVPSTGRGCQGGTSHCLGQGFAKMFDIVFEDETRQRQYVWQNSFGMTTRTIGVMIMVHGDDKGLVLPPPVAYYQVVIVPCGIQAKTTEEEKSDLLAACTKLCAQLKQAGVRSHADLRMHQSPGWRYNYWEQRGVPLRIELGPRELKASNYVACRRDTGEKTSIPQVDVGANVKSLLETIRQNMFERAKATRDARLKQVTDWKEFVPLLNQKCMLLSPWCGDQGCEDEIKQVSANESKQLIQRDENGAEDMRAPSMGAKSLCIPFDQPAGAQGCTCIAPSCEKRAAMFTLFGRSY